MQHFLGVETGFTLDKESNTIAIICQDVTVVLAFDTRERLIQWQVKISSNLGDDQQFLVLVSQAPSKAKISTGPARLHIQELKFCMTSGVPPRLIGFWEIGHLRRYGVIEGRFCFEGGSRCGKGEGLYVLVTDQGSEITKSFQMAAQGKLASRRRQVVRKSSAMESPRKFLHSLQENRVSDALSESMHDPSYEADPHNQSGHRSGSPFWSVESRHTDLDSNYGCGDTASVHMNPDMWPNPDGRGVPASLERCVSCISKLGAPTMSRSSTANTSTLFSPAWTMEPVPACQHVNPVWGSDRISVSSHGTGSSGGSGNSEYSVPRHICQDSRTFPPLPPKTLSGSVQKCQCCPPSRPPKPGKEPAPSPTRKKIKKPPMPLPQEPSCTCKHNNENEQTTESYENYDVPKNIFAREVFDKQPLQDPSNRLSVSPTTTDYYDTPKNIKESLHSADAVPNYGNYDTPPPAKTIRKPCGCVVTFARQAIDAEGRSECPCQRVLCWAENWMLLPYCRRGHGIENTSVPIHKVKLSGEGKMPVVNASGEIAIYATVDKSKKSSKGQEEAPAATNYVNVGPGEEKSEDKQAMTDYQNIDFAKSLELYENSKELLQKVGAAKAELKNEQSEETEGEVSFSVSNGIKVCNKCGHACESSEGNEEDSAGNEAEPAKQEEYMMMEPSRKNFPGYLPMFPSNKTEAVKGIAGRGLPVEKSASVSSLPACTQRGRKRSDCEVRVPGTAMMVGTGKIYFSRLRESDEEGSKPRKRSSSADSSRYLEDSEDGESKTNSPLKQKSPTEEKVTSNSLTSLPYQSPKKNAKASPDSNDGKESVEEEFFERTIVEELTGTINDEDCSSSGSLQTLVHEGLPETASSGTVFIRRSSSVPCKSGNNRDSSSSNDSGVSTGSLKYRGGDFNEFELPLTTSMSARRHQSVVQRHPGTTCLHASLPRRSKSSDPLRELSFNFHATKIPEKSSSAEAEVPICTTKKGNRKSSLLKRFPAASNSSPLSGYFSPGDGVTVPYMDSRSTSSGTSDMSDYIETLSLSSHSSSDAPDSTLHRYRTFQYLRPSGLTHFHSTPSSLFQDHEDSRDHPQAALRERVP